ncbi:hypothetical protein VPHD260_0210 [Vibrio phage D260]
MLYPPAKMAYVIQVTFLACQVTGFYSTAFKRSVSHSKRFYIHSLIPNQ